MLFVIWLDTRLAQQCTVVPDIGAGGNSEAIWSLVLEEIDTGPWNGLGSQKLLTNLCQHQFVIIRMVSNFDFSRRRKNDKLIFVSWIVYLSWALSWIISLSLRRDFSTFWTVARSCSLTEFWTMISLQRLLTRYGASEHHWCLLLNTYRWFHEVWSFCSCFHLYVSGSVLRVINRT